MNKTEYFAGQYITDEDYGFYVSRYTALTLTARQDRVPVIISRQDMDLLQPALDKWVAVGNSNRLVNIQPSLTESEHLASMILARIAQEQSDELDSETWYGFRSSSILCDYRRNKLLGVESPSINENLFIMKIGTGSRRVDVDIL